LSYYLAGYEQNFVSEAFTMKQKRSVVIPGAAENVFVVVQVLYFISNWGPVYSSSLGSSDTLCLALRGTIFYPTVQNC
jgi:hypothetical protein